MSKSCIVIPCFNEQNRILANDFLTFLEQNYNFSFVFIDDGSSDNTFSILKELSNQHERITCHRLNKNQGKAQAIRHSMHLVLKQDYDYYGFIDADLAIPLEELKNLYKELCELNNVDFVYSSKNTKLNPKLEMKLKRYFVGRILSKMVQYSLKINVYDTQCGCKMMTKNIAEISFHTEFISPWLFDIEIFWRIINSHNRKYIETNTKEVPLKNLFNRGSSKIKIIDLIKLPLEFLRIHLHYNRFHAN